MKVAIIPARGGSKRIPDKNITDFCGAPLISYSIKAAEASRLFDAIHISTDSERIAEVAARYGHPVDFMRAPELADDYTPLLPVMQWTLDEYGRRGRAFETACLLMPTAALIEASDLGAAHDLFHAHGGERVVMAVSRFSVPVEWAFHLEDDHTLKPREPGMANVRSQDLRPCYFDSGTFFFASSKAIAEGRLNDDRMIGYCLPREKAIDIDDREDLAFAEIVYRGMRAS
jgi:pseudaminic acid cytidylyltransferase